MVSRTLVLELHVARLEGHLHGETTEDRYRSFVSRLGQPEIAAAIMREYPVLARQLVIALEQWVDSILEFICRLSSDWDSIRLIFSPDADPGSLEHVDLEVSDRHRNGRSVVIATFSSGLKIAYKPKSMSVDAHFQELVTWINSCGCDLPLRTLNIINRGTYGWSEFVAPETCNSVSAVHRFYRRQGVYLALLYMLDATDFHCDNVIASGEDPMLIDLEAVFQPRCMAPPATDEVDNAIIDHSVLRIGLLPGLDWPNAQDGSVDLSGLGATADQVTPFPVRKWEKPCTDEMRLVRERIPLPEFRNRPTLNDAGVSPADYIEDVVDGFADAYRVVLNCRDDFLSKGSLLERFADDEVRVILRHTRTYGELLGESFHPDLLRDALDRDLYFDRLWVAVESCPHLAKVISAESQDLRRGDIPFFTSKPHSRDVWTSSGRCIPEFLPEPPLALVQRRLSELSPEGLSLQLWIIRASMATAFHSHPVGTSFAPDNCLKEQRPVGRDELMTAARTIGDRLESLAIRWKNRASWLGMISADERRWSILPLTLDLYDGLPGVTLFLAYLGVTTGDDRYTRLAQESCTAMLQKLEECRSSIKVIGGFCGWGGIIYTLTHLGTLWQMPGFLAQADSMVDNLSTLIDDDEHLDVVSGAAGCIASLIGLHQQMKSERALLAAVKCGEHLILRGERTENGIGWTIPQQHTPLSGFAHGAAGVAWSLLKLAALAGRAEFQAAALAGIAHERTLFSPETGNWQDLRIPASGTSSPEDGGKQFMTAWCHGASGIGLARMSTLSQLDDSETRQEIHTALNTTLKDGFGHNHSLCHGDVGNLEILWRAGELLNSSWNVEAYRIASNVVKSVALQKYQCGTPLKVESPGLMTGTAGIGYGLLRLAEPMRVPSVLTLEPPIPRNEHIA